MRRHLAALALVAPLVITACSAGTDSGGDSPQDEAADYRVTLDEVPLCSEVWVVGRVLPQDYGGCTDDNGTLVAATYRTCDAGRRYEFTTYDDTSYARRGRPVVDRAGDVADLYADCDGGEPGTSGN